MNQKKEKISDYGFTSKGKFIKKIKYDIAITNALFVLLFN